MWSEHPGPQGTDPTSPDARSHLAQLSAWVPSEETGEARTTHLLWKAEARKASSGSPPSPRPEPLQRAPRWPFPQGTRLDTRPSTGTIGGFQGLSLSSPLCPGALPDKVRGLVPACTGGRQAVWTRAPGRSSSLTSLRDRLFLPPLPPPPPSPLTGASPRGGPRRTFSSCSLSGVRCPVRASPAVLTPGTASRLSFGHALRAPGRLSGVSRSSALAQVSCLRGLALDLVHKKQNLNKNKRTKTLVNKPTKK